MDLLLYIWCLNNSRSICKKLFEYLESKDLEYFIKAPVALQMIIQKSLHIKTKIILKDPNDNSIRKTLNFGHTIGHAIEKDLNFALNNDKMIFKSQMEIPFTEF